MGRPITWIWVSMWRIFYIIFKLYLNNGNLHHLFSAHFFITWIFFLFLHACFLFPLKGWMEYHVVFFFSFSLWWNAMLSLARCYMGWMSSTRVTQKDIFSYCFGMLFYLVKENFKILYYCWDLQIVHICFTVVKKRLIKAFS